MIGTAFTVLASFLPFLVNPIVRAIHPYSGNLRELNVRDQMGKYLSEIYDDPNVIVALHGYRHTCPLSGQTNDEFYCPNVNITISQIEERVDKAMAVFANLGIKEYAFLPPGEVWNEKLEKVLKSRNFSVTPTKILNYRPTAYLYDNPAKIEFSLALKPYLIAIFGANSSKIKYDNFTKILNQENTLAGEYTCGWQNMKSFDDPRYKLALNRVIEQKPTVIILHIQDWNKFTETFLREALKTQPSIKVLRCDDYTIHQKEAQILVELAKEYDILAELVVIPTTYASIPTPMHINILLPISWFAFLLTFVMPTTTFLSWAMLGRLSVKEEKGVIIWNPEKPRVSIIMPAYNEEKIIGASIENALKQDYGKVEVIVVDDGSTDKTRKIAQTYAEKYRRVRVFWHKKNKGKFQALNTGTISAKGKIILHTDSDSILAKNAVRKVVSSFKDRSIGATACLIGVMNDNKILTKLQQIEYIFEQLVVRFCQSITNQVVICPGAGSAFRADVAKATLVLDRTLTEDADYSFEIRRKGWRITQAPDSISFTEAPESLIAITRQRIRWLYGVLQTLTFHKWSIKETWILWAWLGYLLSPLSFLILLSIPIFSFIHGMEYIIYFFPYFIPAFSIFTLSRLIPLYWFGKKKKLVLLFPLYWLYNTYLLLLTLYCFIAWFTRKGVFVRYGGRDIHAV